MGEERSRRYGQRERGRRQGRRGSRRRSQPEPESHDAAYREAHRVADAKVRFYGELIPYGAFALFTLYAVMRVRWLALPLVAISVIWLARLLRRWYRINVAPALRERFVEEEVQKRVQEQLQSDRRVLEGRHSRSMEELSASIAHEIRNPITAAKSLVQQMGEDPAAGENVEYAKVALEELSRVERQVSHLLRFARDESLALGEMQLAEVVESAVDTFRDRLDRTGVALEPRLDGTGAMIGDPEKLRRVVINLVGNAIDALVESATPEPRVDVELGENLAGNAVWLRVHDNGPGIDADTRERIYDPFFSSKQGGTGLGLAITRKVVDAHGGHIELLSEADEGADFLVTLPKRPGPREVPA